MIFHDIYKFACEQPQPMVAAKVLAQRVAAHHEFVGDVRFYLPTLDPSISFGHIVWEMDQTSAYEGQFLVASIRIHNELPRHYRRFVATKELMQVFDSPDAKTDTRAKFLQLLTELESTPVRDNFSPMLSSELEAEWMAMAVLLPPHRKAAYIPKRAEGMTNAQIADETKIPETFIRAIFSEEYDRNLKTLGIDPTSGQCA